MFLSLNQSRVLYPAGPEKAIRRWAGGNFAEKRGIWRKRKHQETQVS
jgi:hypothetical protein